MHKYISVQYRNNQQPRPAFRESSAFCSWKSGFSIMPGVPRLSSMPVQGSIVVPLTYFETFTPEPYVLPSHAFSHQYLHADQHEVLWNSFSGKVCNALLPVNDLSILWSFRASFEYSFPMSFFGNSRESGGHHEFHIVCS